MIKLDDYSIIGKKYNYKRNREIENKELANEEFKRQLALFRKFTLKMTASADTDNGQ